MCIINIQKLLEIVIYCYEIITKMRLLKEISLVFKKLHYQKAKNSNEALRKKVERDQFSHQI